MSSLHIELPSHAEQAEVNLRRWAEVLSDREWARFPGRVETDRYGRVIMTPRPAPTHGARQSEIAYLLRSLSQEGRVITECPVSTADGVKGVDVAWVSPARLTELGDLVCFPHAPDVCVEVRSPSNTDAELREKRTLWPPSSSPRFRVASSCVDRRGRVLFRRPSRLIIAMATRGDRATVVER